MSWEESREAPSDSRNKPMDTKRRIDRFDF